MHLATLALAALCASAAAGPLPQEPPIRFSSTPAPAHDAGADLDAAHVPNSSCVDMLPVHGPNKPSRTDPPYVVGVSSLRVAPGQRLLVTVSGLANETFKGLYIQGRINDKPVGHWEPAANPQVHVSDCEPGRQNALSYVSRTTALDKFSAEWVAGEETGDLIFKATLVKSYSVFWVDVQSPPVKVVAA